nr:hypothetical protein BaRGS_027660 [Batillaria attramentaria]
MCRENTLVQEELKKNLLTHFNAAPSPKPPSGKFMVTVKDGQVVGTDVGEEMSATVPEFDTESWDISRLDQDFEKCLASLESVRVV